MYCVTMYCVYNLLCCFTGASSSCDNHVTILCSHMSPDVISTLPVCVAITVCKFGLVCPEDVAPKLTSQSFLNW